MLSCLALPQQAAAQSSWQYIGQGNNSTISITNASASEGGTASFTLTASPALTGLIAFNVGYSAISSGFDADQDLGSPTIFIQLQNTATITVPIALDLVDEGTETFRVSLTRPLSSVVRLQATGTITETETISLSPAEQEALENTGTFEYTVSLSGTALKRSASPGPPRPNPATPPRWPTTWTRRSPARWSSRPPIPGTRRSASLPPTIQRSRGRRPSR